MSIHKRERKLKNGKTATYYRATVQLLGGKQMTKSFNRKLDAERWELEQRANLTDQGGQIHQQTMTVSDLATYWLENYAKVHLEESSVFRYRGHLENHILPYFGHRRLLDLHSAEVEVWQASLHKDKGLSPKTCNDCLMFFRSLLTHAIRWKFVRHNLPLVNSPDCQKLR